MWWHKILEFTVLGFLVMGCQQFKVLRLAGWVLRFGYWASMVLALRGKHFVTESL